MKAAVWCGGMLLGVMLSVCSQVRGGSQLTHEVRLAESGTDRIGMMLVCRSFGHQTLSCVSGDAYARGARMKEIP